MTRSPNTLIPDEFSLGGLAVGLALAALMGWPELKAALVGAAVGFGLLWVTGAAGSFILKQEAMGGGDIKMMAMVGAFLGWKGALITIMLGALSGSVVGIMLILLKRRESDTVIPFGPFLALGAFTAAFFGPDLIDWYLDLISI